MNFNRPTLSIIAIILSTLIGILFCAMIYSSFETWMFGKKIETITQEVVQSIKDLKSSGL